MGDCKLPDTRPGIPPASYHLLRMVIIMTASFRTCLGLNNISPASIRLRIGMLPKELRPAYHLPTEILYGNAMPKHAIQEYHTRFTMPKNAIQKERQVKGITIRIAS